MQRFIVLFLVSMFLFTLGQPIAFAQNQITKLSKTQKIQHILLENNTYAEDEVLVKFKKNKVDVSRFLGRISTSTFALRHSLERKEILEPQNLVLMKSKKGETTEQLIARLKNNPSVEYIEPNYVRHFVSTTPNDTSFSNLWGLNNTSQTVNGISGTNDADIDAAEAWDIYTGGTDIIVAVLDSGVDYNHPDLENNMWDGSAECKDESNNAIEGGCPNHGWDFLDNDNDPVDNDGHGTHVSGTIGAQGNNNQGVTGVNWTAQIMAVQFIGPAGGTVSDEIKGINFAKNNGAKVINASFGSNNFSQAERDAIASFPGLFVVAAGNAGSDNESIHNYPSDYDVSNIIAVAATDQNDTLSSFSNFGATSVDVGAPGENIYSTYLFATSFNENFEGVATPSIGTQFTAEGTSNNWGTSDIGLSGLGTVLWSDLQNVPYANDADTSITSTAIDLSDKASAQLSFDIFCDTDQTADWTDYLALDISDGSVFNEIERFDEATLGSPDVHSYATDVTAFIDSQTQLRFRWVTDGSNEVTADYFGCFIDNIGIQSLDKTGANYAFLDGTSMATPHVAGEAAMIWGYNPSLTAAQVKSIVETTGDNLTDLADKTTTGKRINLFNALNIFQPRGGFDVPDIIPSSKIIQKSDGSGLVEVGYRARDGIAGLFMGVTAFEYSVDGGETFMQPPEFMIVFSFPAAETVVSSTDFTGDIYHFLIETQSLPELENADENDVVIRFKLSDGSSNLLSPYISSEQFRINNTIPTATLSNTPPSQTNVNTTDITVGGTNVISYQFSLDDSSMSADIDVSTHIQLSNLADGTHTLKIKGKDAQGNVQTSPTSFAWLVDTIGPTGTISNASGNPTNDATPTLNLTISGDGSSVEMQFSCDNATWTDFEPFQSAKTNFNVSSGLNGCVNSDGAKTVHAQLKDSLGNIGASFNTGEFILNSSSALAQLTFTPSNPSNDKNPQFTVAGTDVIAYQFQIDDGGFSEETSILSNIQLLDLADGMHTLQIIGKNNAGTLQAEDSPTEFTWLVDATGPILTVENMSGSPTNIVTPELELSVNDEGVGIDNVTIRFSCDGTSWTDFESFQETKNDLDVHSGLNGCKDHSGSGTDDDPLSAADGARIIFAQAQDSLFNLGEVAQTDELILDITAPNINFDIDPSDALLNKGDLPTPVKSKTWTWDSDEADAVFRFLINQSEDSEPAPTGEYGIVKTATQSTGDGLFHLHVQSKDFLGNESKPQNQFALLDNTAPTATLINSPNNPTKLNSINVTVAGEGVTHYKFKIDAEDLDVETPIETPIVLSDLANGEHTIEVIGRDIAGNYQTELSSTRVTWTVDTALVTAILGGAPASPTNATATTIIVSGINVDFYKFKVDAESFSAETAVSEHITLSNLTQGTHQLAVLGRSTTGSYPVEAEATVFSWIVDLTPPIAVLTGAPTGSVTDTSATIAISGTDVTHYRFILDTQPIGPETLVSTPISLTSLNVGSHTLKVIGRDAAGNYQTEANASQATWIVLSTGNSPGGGGGGGGGGSVFFRAPTPQPIQPAPNLLTTPAQTPTTTPTPTPTPTPNTTPDFGPTSQPGVTGQVLGVSIDILSALREEASSPVFPDVDNAYRLSKTIRILKENKIIQGYPDQTFKPFNIINRAEFLKIIVVAVYGDIPEIEQGESCEFSDISSDKWFAKFVCFAKAQGLIKGYSDGTFRPGQTINFVEALAIAMRAYGYDLSGTTGENWFQSIVMQASMKSLMPQSIRGFNHQLTRGEMADLIVRFMAEKGDLLDEYLEETDGSKFHITYACLKNNSCVTEIFASPTAVVKPVEEARPVEEKKTTATFIEVLYPAVRVRNGIGYETKIVKLVHQGERLEYVGEQDDWYQLYNKDGSARWIEGKWVKKVP